VERAVQVKHQTTATGSPLCQTANTVSLMLLLTLLLACAWDTQYSRQCGE
jgi:hypothetical protein